MCGFQCLSKSDNKHGGDDAPEASRETQALALPQKVGEVSLKGASKTVAPTLVSRVAPGSIQAAVPSATFCARPPGGEVDGSVSRT